MKTKWLLLVLGTLLIAGGVWIGRDAWRRHRQLISLNVRNAPLSEVLRQVERQIGKKIRAEKSLDGHITLNVKDKTLSYILDRISEQAGAHWSTLYAVYVSTRALETLQSALQGDGKLEPVGWTRVAPAPPNFEPDDAPGMDSDSPPPKPERGGQMMMFRKMGNGPVVIQGGPAGEMELWSPEELVMESALRGKIGDDHDQLANAEAAAKLAAQVNGQWTTLLSLRKSIMGINLGGMPGPMAGNGPGFGPGPGPLKHSPNDRFARLTPQQRVLQARQRMQFNNPSPAN